MASVVFMRGANVGGHKTFKPAALARELSALGVVSIGAAGTFVVRKTATQAFLRAEWERRLPFVPQLMICRGQDVLDLVEKAPFPGTADEDLQRFVSVLVKRPGAPPALPLSQPAGRAWEVRLVAVLGRFALCLRRRTMGSGLYPNEVVEAELGVLATTRSWSTIQKIHEVLRDS